MSKALKQTVVRVKLTHMVRSPFLQATSKAILIEDCFFKCINPTIMMSKTLKAKEITNSASMRSWTFIENY
jgi:hypothetical protein